MLPCDAVKACHYGRARYWLLFCPSFRQVTGLLGTMTSQT